MTSHNDIQSRQPEFRKSPLSMAVATALGLTYTSQTWAVDPGDPTSDLFQVNSSATDDQMFSDVATDADGDFVVTWASGQYNDGFSNGDIFAQRYDATGRPQGDEFLVNTNTSFGSQENPAVAMDSEGNFVIVWDGPDPANEGSTRSIFYKTFDDSGEPQGNELRANSATGSDKTDPAVAMDADGDFAIAWGEENYYGEINTRLFSTDCPTLVAEIEVAATGSPRDPAIAMDADGDFVVTWEDQYYGSEIKARRFDSTNCTLEEVIEVTQRSVFSGPEVAMDSNGNFVIVWSAIDLGVFAQRFDSAGQPRGGEIRVDTTTSDTFRNPAVAADTDGDFVVAWHNNNVNFEGVLAQRFNAVGQPQGKEFEVTNKGTDDSFPDPAVAMDADGDFVIAWENYGPDGDGFGVFARRFAGPEDVDLSLVMTDSPDPVAPGSPFSYTLTITNNHAQGTRGIGTSTGIRVTDILPNGATFESSEGTDWSCNQSARTAPSVECTFSDKLAPTMSASTTLTFNLTSPAAANIENTATVNGDQFDSDASNNADTEATTVAPPDTDPDPFMFTPIENAPLNTLVESNPITITGIDAPAPISITGVASAEYSINGGPFSRNPGTVNEGATIKVRQVSWSEPLTTTNATLIVGAKLGTFSVTTSLPQSLFSNNSSGSRATANISSSSARSSGGGGALGWVGLLGLLLSFFTRRRV